jgi:hypothetical protein
MLILSSRALASRTLTPGHSIRDSQISRDSETVTAVTKNPRYRDAAIHEMITRKYLILKAFKAMDASQTRLPLFNVFFGVNFGESKVTQEAPRKRKALFLQYLVSILKHAATAFPHTIVLAIDNAQHLDSIG